VRAIRLLFAATDPRSEFMELQLRLGERSIPLPQGNDWEVAAARIGRPQPVQEPRSGAYCLATYTYDGEMFGAVQQLLALQEAPKDYDSFSVGCSRGESAAIRWMLERAGLREIHARFRFEPTVVTPLPQATSPRDKVGESAGVAAAIATVHSVLAPRTPLFIAATGSVGPYGNVLQVANIGEKVAAVVREAPFVSKVFVPRGSSIAVDGVEVIEVGHVDEVLVQLFGNMDLSPLPMLAPERAAKLAVQSELKQEHGVASTLARALLATEAYRRLDAWNATLAEVRSRIVVAANLTHEGEAKRALEEFVAIDHVLAVARRPLPVEERALLTAFRASTQIDVLDDRALDECSRYADRVEDLSPLSQVLLLGSWSRALLAAGRTDEAVEKAEAQVDATHYLDLEDRGQRSQATCNLISALLGRGRREDLDRARTLLEDAYAFNRSIPEQYARTKNQWYLDFWQCRYLAAVGQTDAALAFVQSETSGRFPSNLAKRYIAEALLNAGGVDAALSLLVRSLTEVRSSGARGFEELVLLTAAAVEAIARIDFGLPDWEVPARTFLTALASWHPNLATNYAPGMDAIAMRPLLSLALRRIPY
jgi:hypothetical protein